MRLKINPSELADPVPNELLVAADDLGGWSPTEADFDPDGVRPLGIVTPVEVALQSMFGNHVFSSVRVKSEWDISPEIRFKMHRDEALGIFTTKKANHHDLAFFCALSTYQDRLLQVDLEASFKDFSTATDGYLRSPTLWRGDSYSKEILRYVDGYSDSHLNGHWSRRSVEGEEAMNKDMIAKYINFSLEPGSNEYADHIYGAVEDDPELADRDYSHRAFVANQITRQYMAYSLWQRRQAGEELTSEELEYDVPRIIEIDLAW